jgi:hypothetical protein
LPGSLCLTATPARGCEDGPEGIGKTWAIDQARGSNVAITTLRVVALRLRTSHWVFVACRGSPVLAEVQVLADSGCLDELCRDTGNNREEWQERPEARPRELWC